MGWVKSVIDCIDYQFIDLFYQYIIMEQVNTLSSSLVLLLAPGLPLLLAVSLMSGAMSRAALVLAPWAALPAFLISLFLSPDMILKLPWLLLGTHLGFDETARMFLMFTALVWLTAGVYSMGYFKDSLARARFLTWFLLAMTGNFGLILAQDMIAFYTFFTLMSFSSYALVIYERTLPALRAGLVYIVMVVVGEIVVFVAFVLAALSTGSLEFEIVQAAVAGSDWRNWIIGLALFGLGIKAGVIGLHFWLPLAHPAAPTPASAVLSGAMISAGLLGWLRILPLGEVSLPGWGGLMIAAGTVAIFYAVLVGLLQSNPKTVLAYSSVSKMGNMTIAVGLGMIAPDNWPLILSAILFYALHHGLAKGALFLGVGIAARPPVSKRQRAMLILGLLLPALSLAAAPLTSGMAAKNLLTVQVISTAYLWSDWLKIILLCGSVATSILMVHFLSLVWPQQEVASDVQAAPASMWLSWIFLLFAVALSPFILWPDLHNIWTLKTQLSAIWPAALGVAIAACIWLNTRYQWLSWSLRIPQGEQRLMIKNRLYSIIKSAQTFALKTLPKWRIFFLAGCNRWHDRSNLWFILDSVEKQLRHWRVGITFCLLLGMIFVFLAAQH